MAMAGVVIVEASADSLAEPEAFDTPVRSLSDVRPSRISYGLWDPRDGSVPPYFAQVREIRRFRDRVRKRNPA